MWGVLAAEVHLFTADAACVHTVRGGPRRVDSIELERVLWVARVGSSDGHVSLGGLGCGKALWGSPGHNPGVVGALLRQLQDPAWRALQDPWRRQDPW